MLEWLERAESERVFLDDGDRRLTYGEAARQVAAGDRDRGSLHPALTIDGVLEILSLATRGRAVLLGPGHAVPDPTIENQPGFLVFTSGTSGTPKPVPLTWENWGAAAKSSMAHLGHGREDTWLLAMPLHHVAGLGIVLRSAFAGGRVRLLPEFDAETYAGALRQVTMASVVPTMLHRVLAIDTGPYSGLRAVLVGGGPIPERLLEDAARAGMPVLPTYGMTETCGQVATLRPGAPLARRAHPLPGVEIRVAEGRVEVRGPMVSTRVLDRDGWFRTGDLGELDDDGALRILGRADDIIITGGENVSPAAVEAALLRIEGVDEVAVFGISSAEWGVEVGAVYTGSAPPERLVEELPLPGHARPTQIRRVDLMPKTALGKLDRVAASRLLD